MSILNSPWMFRFFLIPLFLLLFVPANGNATVPCAIRWDAWYTNTQGDPGWYSAKALSRPEWRDRVPLHGEFAPDGKVTWKPTQVTFDDEIRAASKANLCWAYLMYGTNHAIDLNVPLMKGLQYQRSSTIKNRVKYAMMTTSGLFGTAGNYDAAVAAAADLLHDSNYQFITINGEKRPLLFLFYNDADIQSAFGGKLSELKRAIDALRAKSKSSGSGNPYLVLVAGPASKAEDLRKQLGGDAISEYISGTRRNGAEPWATFEPTIEEDWNIFSAASQAGSIPTLRSGADIRARCETPPPYEHRFPTGSACTNYVINPSLEELGIEFKHAAQWLDQNTKSDPGRVLLIYAWSECDESGNCLMPTYGDPTGKKLTTIQAALH